MNAWLPPAVHQRRGSPAAPESRSRLRASPPEGRPTREDPRPDRIDGRLSRRRTGVRPRQLPAVGRYETTPWPSERCPGLGNPASDDRNDRSLNGRQPKGLAMSGVHGHQHTAPPRSAPNRTQICLKTVGSQGGRLSAVPVGSPSRQSQSRSAVRGRHPQSDPGQRITRSPIPDPDPYPCGRLTTKMPARARRPPKICGAVMGSPSRGTARSAVSGTWARATRRTTPWRAAGPSA